MGRRATKHRDVTFTFRMGADLKRRLRKLARSNKRSMADEVNELVSFWLVGGEERDGGEA